MLKTLLSFLLWSCCVAAFAQNDMLLQGSVRDQLTGEPLPFVSIGLRQGHRGTIATETGEFQLQVPTAALKDTLQFSYMGYGLVRMPVASMKGRTVQITMRKESILLAEAIAKPLLPEDYVRLAVKRIPENYANTPAMATGYYYELTTENSTFLKFEEAVTATYVPGIMDTLKGHSTVLHARAAKDVETMKFMQSRNARKKKKAEKRGKEFEPLIESDDLVGGTSGPSAILGSDPVRERPEFLNPKEFKHFRFKLESIVAYAGRKLMVISFDQRKKIDHHTAKGKLYIDVDSYAFVAVEYEGKVVIPALLKPVIAMAGLGISNPTFTIRVHYREHGGLWHVASAHQDIDIRLSTTEMFRKNDRSAFHIEQAFVVTELETDNVQPIAKELRLDSNKSMTEQAQHKDPGFWDSYTPVRPKRLEAYTQ
jgi:hypothetical protein